MKLIFFLLLILTTTQSFNFNNMRKKSHMYVFKKITTALPELHRKGDDVLHSNEKIINEILESDIDDKTKKNLIKALLDFTISADSVAGKFLKIYRKLVDEIL